MLAAIVALAMQAAVSATLPAEWMAADLAQGDANDPVYRIDASRN